MWVFKKIELISVLGCKYFLNWRNLGHLDITLVYKIQKVVKKCWEARTYLKTD